MGKRKRYTARDVATLNGVRGELLCKCREQLNLLQGISSKLVNYDIERQVKRNENHNL